MALGSNVSDIWNFLRLRKKWWLAPIIIFTLVISLLIVSMQNSAVAPFIYPLF